MTQFLISCKESRIETNRSFYSSFLIGPFESNESLTFANALRRTLLSELSGIAIISVEIEGASHEYSNLPGVRDTVLDILLNLKDIVLKKISKNMRPQLGYLRARGPGVVRASDLRLPPFIQCVDPNQYIATLAEDGILNMKFVIDEGKNYIKGKPKSIIDINQFKKRRLILKKLNEVSNTSSLLKNYYFYLNKKDKAKLQLKSKTFKVLFDSQSNTFLANKKKPILNNELKKKIWGTSTLSKNLQHLKPKFLPLNLLNIDAVFNPINKVNYIIEINEHKSIETLFNQSNLIENTYKIMNASKNFGWLETFPISYNMTNFGSKSAKLWISQFHLQSEKTKSSFSLVNQNCLENLLNYQLNLSKLKTLSYKQISDNQINKIQDKELKNKEFKIKNFEGNSGTFIKPLSDSNDSLNLEKIIDPNINVLEGKLRGSWNNDNLENVAELFYLKNRDSFLKDEKTLELINPTINNQGLDIWTSKENKNQLKHNVIVEIWTNGSLHPREALYQALKHLVKLFSKLTKVKMLSEIFKSDRNYKNLITKIKNENFSLLPVNQSLFVGKYTGIKPQLNKLEKTLNSVEIELTQDQKNKRIPKQKKFTEPGVNTARAHKKSKTGFSLNSKSQSFLQMDSPNLIDIGNLNISLRPYSCLKRSNINTVGDLLKKSKNDLLKLPNLGKKSLEEIEKSLAELGLKLN